jgi:M6 family metalloprotease-like protein
VVYEIEAISRGGWLMDGWTRSPLATLLLAAVGLASLGKSCEPSPYAPQNVRLASVPPTRPCAIYFEWDAPAQTPPSGVRGYTIYRDGVEVGTAGPNTLRFWDLAWLSEAPLYRYVVRTNDWAGSFYPTSKSFEAQGCPPPTPAPTLGVQVLLMKFPDLPDEPFAPGEMEDLLFGEPESLAAWWAANSYGQQALEPASYGMIGWLTMPHPIGEYCEEAAPGALRLDCDLDRMQQDALDVSSGFGPYPWWFQPVDRLLVVYSGYGRSELKGMDIYSFGFVSGAVFSARGALELETLAHEMGHTFGLPHAGSVTCTDGAFPPNPFDPASGGCKEAGYGDPRDPMGHASAFSDHYAGLQKEMLGFLAPSRIRVVPATAEGTTVRIHRIQDDVAGIQLVKIPTRAPVVPGSAAHLLVEHVALPNGSSAVVIRMKLGRHARSLYGAEISSSAGPPFLEATQGIRIDWIGSGTAQGYPYADVRIDVP